MKLLQARILGTKLVVYRFYITVHRFLARVQSLTCTNYGKLLLESIMNVLTPKSGILRMGVLIYADQAFLVTQFYEK